jgi:hypothetical protein
MQAHRPPTLLPPGPKLALLYAFAVRGLPRPEKQPRYPTVFATYPGDCYATTNFLDQGFGRTGDCSWRFMPRRGAHLTGSRLIRPNPLPAISIT